MYKHVHSNCFKKSSLTSNLTNNHGYLRLRSTFEPVLGIFIGNGIAQKQAKVCKARKNIKRACPCVTHQRAIRGKQVEPGVRIFCAQVDTSLVVSKGVLVTDPLIHCLHVTLNRE